MSERAVGELANILPGGNYEKTAVGSDGFSWSIDLCLHNLLCINLKVGCGRAIMVNT